VPDNKALTTKSAVDYPEGIWRDDYCAGCGAPPLFYRAGATTCSPASGDGGSQVPSTDGKCWLAVFPAAGADVREFGAKGDGKTDDEPAIAACAAAASRCLLDGIRSFTTTLKSSAAAGALRVRVAGAQSVAPHGAIYIQGAGPNAGTYIGSVTNVSGAMVGVLPRLSTAVSAGAAARGKMPIRYRLAETLKLPEGSDLEGVGFTPGWQPIGATLVCDLAVTPCIDKGALVALSSNDPRNSAMLKGVIQSRAQGTIPPRSIGILEDEEQEALIENVYATEDDTCLEYLSNSPVGSGVQAHADHIWTGNCPTTHVEINGWPVVVMHDLKLASGTGPEQTSKQYFLVTGGPVGGNVDAGPSTVSVDQFEIFGALNTQTFVNFAHCPNCQPINDVSAHSGAGIFAFTNGHAENICHVITTDRTITDLQDFEFTHATVFGPGNPGRCTAAPNFFEVDPATLVDSWNISDNMIVMNGILAPTPAILSLHLGNNDLRQSAWRIIGAPGSKVSAGNNTTETIAGATGSFYLQGGPFLDLKPGTPVAVVNLKSGASAPLLPATEQGGLIITSGTDRGTAQYLLGGAAAELLAATTRGWARTATCAPPLRQQSVCFDPGRKQYIVVNNTGRSASYFWTPTLAIAGSQ
jgi:hypothetical protein